MNKKMCIIIVLVVMVFISISSVVYAADSLVKIKDTELKARQLEKETVTSSQVAVMIIIAVIGTLVYITLNCFRKNTQKNEKVTKTSKKAVCIGILIIVSFCTIATLESVISRVNISVDMNNIIVKILLVVDFLFMISVVCGIFCYRKYKEVSPMWLNLIYIIGVILLVCFVGNFYSKTNDSQKEYESQIKYMQNSIENRKWN